MSETTTTRCDVIGCESTRDDDIYFNRQFGYGWAHIELDRARSEYDMCPDCVRKYLVPILERK